MVIARLESALKSVQETWEINTALFESAARELLAPPDWQLSRMLIETALLGAADLSVGTIEACLALELLDQALRLGQSAGSVTYIESHLLITDYLYAQAIAQVITINRPPVIARLARAIMLTAGDRVNEDTPDHRRRLVEAAAGIGAFLGGSVNDNDADSIASAAR